MKRPSFKRMTVNDLIYRDFINRAEIVHTKINFSNEIDDFGSLVAALNYISDVLSMISRELTLASVPSVIVSEVWTQFIHYRMCHLHSKPGKLSRRTTYFFEFALDILIGRPSQLAIMGNNRNNEWMNERTKGRAYNQANKICCRKIRTLVFL